MMLIGKKFVGKYSLSKTLRFELKPVGETADHINNFKNQGLIEAVKRDSERAQNYKAIKKMLDDYHRYFIEKVLQHNILTTTDINEAFDLYMQVQCHSSHSEENQKKHEKKQDELRKKIAKAFADKQDDYALFDAKLLNEKKSGKNPEMPVLWQWIKQNFDANKITQDEFAYQESLIKSFNQFSTYFTGFYKNRKNIYSDNAHRTAISYRIVHENMIKHFDNCIRYETIRKQYPTLAEQLNQYEAFFAPLSFQSCLAQSGIDKYNETIGHKSEDINAKGVNQLINEFRQKNNIKPRELPIMAPLYKQILSDIEARFYIDEFNNDKEVFVAIEALYEELVSNGIIQALKQCLVDHLQNGNLDTIFIKNDISLTDISQKIWGDWAIIKSAIKDYTLNELGKKASEKKLKEEFYSIQWVQNAIDYYLNNNEQYSSRSVVEYFQAFQSDGINLLEKIEQAYQNVLPVLALEELSKNRQVKDGHGKPGEGFEQIEKIKDFLESLMAVVHFVKPLYMVKGGKKLELGEINADFYDQFYSIYEDLFAAINVYNKVRNYVTKKPYKTEKFKINFENSTLLAGWDVNKESANSSVLLLRDGNYYLGVMKKGSSGIFNYNIEPDDGDSKVKSKNELKKDILPQGEEECFEKMIYKSLKDSVTMIPKCSTQLNNVVEHFQESEEDYVLSSSKFTHPLNISREIYDLNNKVYDEETGGFVFRSVNNEKGFKKFQKKYLEITKDELGYRNALGKWIDFCKCFLLSYSSCRYFTFNFKPTNTYDSLDSFYKDINSCIYAITFDKIKASYIEAKVASGELFLFQIYNKDFSPFSKGRPNLHTSYWKLLFSEDNLNNLVIKLNGEAEIFFRPSSLRKDDVVIHHANEVINNKNPLNPKKQSRFDYAIVKDRRYTMDKFFFHCPITLNFREGNYGKFNERVNEFLAHNKDINVIGIDRGERHLLYYTVIDQSGSILEQGSLNNISNTLACNGQKMTKETNYRGLLDQREKARDAARKSWSAIENIKELKSGYLSHVVHKIAQLMIKYNAIVALEDLNFGFKRGRFKFEKQVYQKFEKALIDKLNYLVFKGQDIGQPGHYLKAYQLTAPFESFQKLGKQSGFLFYVTSDYTSKIDPFTGFVNLLPTRYESIEKSRDFFHKFDSIHYNSEADYFEFVFDYNKFKSKFNENQWIACTYGKERYRYNKAKQAYDCCDVTAALKDLFDKSNIDYFQGDNLMEVILNMSQCKKDGAEFFRSLMSLLRLTLQLRYTYKDVDAEQDYILSPIANAEGKFFDSRHYDNNSAFPANADANGAYNIARKGLLTLKSINEKGKPLPIKNADWFAYAQGHN